jgi:3',5'-cyclic AMP phosphodiesterase CpdA
MRRIAWATDIHLNFVGQEQIVEFCRSIKKEEPDALLITGDIGEAHDVHRHLQLIGELVSVPVYFVLGNHDYYGSSIAEIRERVTSMSRSISALTYLSVAGIVALSENTCFIGHDGWADGRFGDYAHSQVMLNDYRMIQELRDLSRRELLKRLHALGDEAADHFRSVLPQALTDFHHVIVATHVPPFREACWHEGNISNDEYLPHFACKAVGKVLAAAIRKRPDRRMTVLCGHTHSSGEAQILGNLTVKTGGATYGRPALNEIITVI